MSSLIFWLVWITVMVLHCPVYAVQSWSVVTISDSATEGNNTGTMTTYPPYSGSLPFCILNSGAGDSITCMPIAGQTIALTQSLPEILSLTITGATVTIQGNGTNTVGFSVATGPVTLSNFIITDCVSQGGAGGAGSIGGGGGVGGGGGLYVHNGVNLTIGTVTFSGNKAIGGAGGSGSGSSGGGGGGGGFGGGSGGASASNGGGGGGGGYAMSGNGGGGAGTPGIFFGGGGGGSGGAAGGGANTSGQGSTTPAPPPKFAGGTSSLGGGGGGAGASAAGAPSTATGGAGGAGIGSDSNFGGGGGGGGGGAGNGGAGAGGGGGGGSASGGTTGGAGGSIGGGGGGGVGANGGGAGAFGGGGGASGSGTGGTSLYGGGTGGVGGGSSGGGGAAFGGSIFIENGGVLNIGDGIMISGGAVTGGSPGGSALGPDIFLQSGGSLNFNLMTAPLTISSAIDSDQGKGGGTGGGLMTQGNQTLTLSSGSNTYTGGTTIISGTLSIVGDGSLGASSEELTMYTSTLQTTGAWTSARAITLDGTATLDADGNPVSLSGIISGSGAFNLMTTSGASIVTLTGTNTYTGGTNVAADITLSGNTTSLSGNIALQAASSILIFNQSSSGVYAGSLSGVSGSLLQAQGSGTLQTTGNNAGFLGTVHVLSGINLQVDSSLASTSLVTIDPGATLSGTSIIGGPVNNSGTISPGDGSSIGTLTVNHGALNFKTSTSALNITVAPLNVGDLVRVNGDANLNGVVNCSPQTGFFGFTASYTFLTSIGLGGTEFSSLVIPSAFAGSTISYTLTNAILNLYILEPFLNFPFTSANRRHVGEYLDALNVAHVINPELITIVNSMAGFTDSQINDALDLMHPAMYSALVGALQPSMGGQLLSLFHRRPTLSCGCEQGGRFWAVPMGNWLKEGNLGEQRAYEAQTRGVAVGLDGAIGQYLVLGIGGAWNESSLLWQHNYGTGTVHRYLGALYADFMSESFYCGLSAYGGIDDNNITRHIEFSTNRLFAHGHFNSLDIGGQFSAAYLFGSRYCLLYPYANGDYFYFRAQKFTETGADALNLEVDSHLSSTVRAEAGIGLQVQDTNYNETICVAPTVELGWAMECPINRPAYHARFIGEPFGFEAKGWDHTFQVFTVDIGLKITLYNFSLSGEYRTEMAPDGRDDFWDQRCNINLQYAW